MRLTDRIKSAVVVGLAVGVLAASSCITPAPTRTETVPSMQENTRLREDAGEDNEWKAKAEKVYQLIHAAQLPAVNELKYFKRGDTKYFLGARDRGLQGGKTLEITVQKDDYSAWYVGDLSPENSQESSGGLDGRVDDAWYAEYDMSARPPRVSKSVAYSRFKFDNDQVTPARKSNDPLLREHFQLRYDSALDVIIEVLR